MSVLSLAIAIMPKTEPVIAQNSTDAEYVQAISALSRATKYTVSSDSVGGNMTIGGGKADDPAPIGTKMYFSYKVLQIEKCAHYGFGSWFEEGVTVSGINSGDWIYTHGKTYYNASGTGALLQAGCTYYA